MSKFENTGKILCLVINEMNCHLSKTLIFRNQSKECETVKDNVQHQISQIKLKYFIWLLRLVPPKNGVVFH